LLPLFVAVLLAGATPDLPSFAGAAGRFYNTAVPLTNYDRLLSVTDCIADFLASSAIIVSLGVAMATWIRRLGRAVALSVIVYFLTGIGWVLLCEVLISSVIRQYTWMQDNQRLFIMTAVSLSPIGGPINPISHLEQFVNGPRWPEWIGAGAVLIIKVAVAWLLFLLTVKTFDRCVGRVPEVPATLAGKRAHSLQALQYASGTAEQP
ncbi:MAG TPA: hypothetical protein VGY53_07020, partial [Isosphaeraceae bacterium]|nr:hypothetical protein [Isosphaeraceae bacterium]